jgi:hypothetical protein
LELDVEDVPPAVLREVSDRRTAPAGLSRTLTFGRPPLLYESPGGGSTRAGITVISPETSTPKAASGPCGLALGTSPSFGRPSWTIASAFTAGGLHAYLIICAVSFESSLPAYAVPTTICRGGERIYADIQPRTYLAQLRRDVYGLLRVCLRAEIDHGHLVRES